MGGFPIPLGRFRRDRRGAAAVEFALVVPALLFLYMGVVDSTTAVAFDQKMDTCANTINDLVSQMNPPTKAEVEKVFAVKYAMLPTFIDKELQIKVTVVNVASDGTATVGWSMAQNTPARTKGSNVTLPADLSKLTQSTVILTEMSYPFTYVQSGYGLVGPTQLKAAIYGQPRGRAGVACADCS
jgi:Flp pilus assembly protein TadG